MNTVRLTTAQALVRYLQAQWSERDGDRRRLIPGVWGIFGHGNVIGVGQALEEVGDELTFHQGRNEQSMVHAAAAFAKATRRRQTLACTASIGPGSTNMVTGAAGATINRLPVLLLAGRRVRDAPPGPRAPAARAPDVGRRLGQRLLPPGRPLLRPDHAARAAADGAARGDARAHVAGRDGRGRARAAAGRAVARVGLPRALLRRARVADRAPAPGSAARRRGGRAAPRGRAAAADRGRRRALQRGRGGAPEAGARHGHPGRGDVRRQGRGAGRRAGSSSAASGSRGTRRRRGSRWTPTSCSPSARA